MTTTTIPSPARARDALDRGRRRDRHADARPPRLAQRDEPGDDLRAHRRLRLARRPGAAARPGGHRRRRARVLAPAATSTGSRAASTTPTSTCPPNVRRGAEVLHQAIVDFRRIPYPVIGGGQRGRRRRRLLAGADVRHPDRLDRRRLRLRLRADRRLARRRHDLLPAPGGRAGEGARAAAQRPAAERRRRRSSWGSSRRWSPRTSCSPRRGRRPTKLAREGAPLRADGEAADRREPRQLAHRAPAGRAPRDRRLDGRPRTCARASTAFFEGREATVHRPMRRAAATRSALPIAARSSRSPRRRRRSASPPAATTTSTSTNQSGPPIDQPDRRGRRRRRSRSPPTPTGRSPTTPTELTAAAGAADDRVHQRRRASTTTSWSRTPTATRSRGPT